MKSILIFAVLLLNPYFKNYTIKAQTSLDSTVEAKRIYNKLTGKFLLPTNPLTKQMIAQIEANNNKQAARLATSEASFVGAVVRNWGANLISKNQDPLMPLNDSLAMLMGAVRDNMNAKLILSGNFSYGISPKFNQGPPKESNNISYDFLDDGVKEVGRNLYRYTPQWNNTQATDLSGILTTRFWSKVNYFMGTNRRAVVNTLEGFLCKPNSTWKKPNLPTDRIRQDIDRFPTGNPKIFQTECRSCHATMDGLAGAFAKIDFRNESINWSSTVQAKYLQHNDIYPDGFITQDTSWMNYIDNVDSSWGWKTPKAGVGINQLGIMLSESDAFKTCMVKTVVKSMCGKNLENNPSDTKAFVTKWEADGLGFLDLFLNVAISPICK